MLDTLLGKANKKVKSKPRLEIKAKLPDLLKMVKKDHGLIPRSSDEEKEEVEKEEIAPNVQALVQESMRDLRQGFEMMDRNKNGYVTKEQFRQVIEIMDVIPGDLQLFDLIEDAYKGAGIDQGIKNKSDLVKYNDFVDLLEIRMGQQYTGDDI